MNAKTPTNPKGAGAPKKAPTKPIFIRVPESQHKDLDRLCRDLVSEFLRQNKA